MSLQNDHSHRLLWETKTDPGDINYSCLTYVIDSGLKLSVTRKDRTD